MEKLTNTTKTMLIIIATIIIMLCIAGRLENAYFYYKQENPPISFTQYYLGGHWNDTDDKKDPNSPNYRGF